jgi:hypothetical protein
MQRGLYLYSVKKICEILFDKDCFLKLRKTAWNKTKQTQFIEQLFFQIPPNVLVLEQTSILTYELKVIRGNDELVAIRDFVAGEIRLNSPLIPEINGLFYHEIRGEVKHAMRLKFDYCNLPIFIKDDWLAKINPKYTQKVEQVFG